MPACSDVYFATTDGGLDLNGQSLGARDGASIRGESLLTLKASEDTDLVMVEVCGGCV